MRHLRFHLLFVAATVVACHGDRYDDGVDDTTEVGTFDGLFDDVGVGLNFPLDIAIVPDDLDGDPTIVRGDILVANYGTSEIMHVEDPSGRASVEAVPFFAGPDADLRGATAVSVLPDGTVWATFEQGGDSDDGGIVVLSPTGEQLALIDGSTAPGAFANPGGICWGGTLDDGAVTLVFFVNLGDGTAWRVAAVDSIGTDAEVVQVGRGLATGRSGRPGTPGEGLTSSSDLPEDGARGCAYYAGSLYVADAQNARIVRFDGADRGADLDGVELEDTPSELVTYPTDVAVNNEGALIIVSYDNAHAFVSLETPSGAFIDNGLHDLNVNSGNYGVALAEDTIWFTRANNSNGVLRAITEAQDIPPDTEGPIPPQ